MYKWASEAKCDGCKTENELQLQCRILRSPSARRSQPSAGEEAAAPPRSSGRPKGEAGPRVGSPLEKEEERAGPPGNSIAVVAVVLTAARGKGEVAAGRYKPGCRCLRQISLFIG